MRRAVFLIVLLCILALAGTAHAVTLEQGWYAQVRSVDLIYRSVGAEYESHAQPRILLASGVYGPYRVSRAPYEDNYCKTVDIPTSASGIEPGTAVELPLATGLMDTDVIEAFYIGWYSDYIASHMQLQLIRHDATNGNTRILWSQTRSGAVNGYDEILALDVYPDGLAFRVITVPEPHSWLVLAMGILATAIPLRRKRCGR